LWPSWFSMTFLCNLPSLDVGEQVF
jgi:hypothetical protein